MEENRVNTEIAKRFGKNLKHLIKNNNLTYEEFAKAIDSDKATISLWGSGKRFPSPYNLEVISKYFNIDVLCLFDPLGTASMPVQEEETAIKFKVPVMMNGEDSSSIIMIDEMAFAGEKRQSNYALRVSDTSMSPTYPVGTIVMYSKEGTIGSNNLAVMILNNSRVLRHVYHVQDLLVITCDNPEYPPVVFPFSDYQKYFEGYPVLTQTPVN